MKNLHGTASTAIHDTGEASWLKKLGPGLITGAADDDPSGIATYSQAGAQFGFSLLWTLFFTYPLMVGSQEVMATLAIARRDSAEILQPPARTTEAPPCASDADARSA